MFLSPHCLSSMGRVPHEVGDPVGFYTNLLSPVSYSNPRNLRETCKNIKILSPTSTAETQQATIHHDTT